MENLLEGYSPGTSGHGDTGEASDDPTGAPSTEHRELEAAEVFQFVLSAQATTRARFTAIMQTMARILARLEDADEASILEELTRQFEIEREKEAEALKEYMRRDRN